VSKRDEQETGGRAAAFADIERAIADVAAGRPVIVVDDEDRENEGDLIFAAEKATPELLAFMVRYTSGYVCAPLPESDCDRLDLPPMYHTNQDRRGTAYTVTVDAAAGVSTGISATDRAHTIRLLADAESKASDFNRPGHVVPLRAKEGGVLRRPGHTEAAVDLARLAGLRPAGVLCELVSQKDEGDMARREELQVFAADHDLEMITIADLIAYRRRTEKQVQRVADARIPTAHGTFRAVGYDSVLDGIEHIALVYGEIGNGEDILVRVHSECLTGDVFGSRRCDCGDQLKLALARLQEAGGGIILYLAQEGRGVGLANKMRTYKLQDGGLDTVDANTTLGFDDDERDYGVAVRMLQMLGCTRVVLLTNNPAKLDGLTKAGIEIAGRMPIETPINSDNRRYLTAKASRAGHHLRHVTAALAETPEGDEEARLVP